ncbi:hypothetical protein HK101_008068 [Irineochytrium annulatum]|nr:hypothetical protein HK101_008068 [Irineochytrium annulatum]
MRAYNGNHGAARGSRTLPRLTRRRRRPPDRRGLKRKAPNDGKPRCGGKAAPVDDNVINLDDGGIIEIKVDGQPGGSGLQGGCGKRASFGHNGYDDSGTESAGSRVALFEDDDGMGMEEHMREEENMDDDHGTAWSKEDNTYWDTRYQYAPRQQNHGRHEADSSSTSMDLTHSNACDDQHLRYERERDRWAATQRGSDDQDTHGVVGPNGNGSRRGGSPPHDDSDREDETPPLEGTAGGQPGVVDDSLHVFIFLDYLFFFLISNADPVGKTDRGFRPN